MPVKTNATRESIEHTCVFDAAVKNTDELERLRGERQASLDTLKELKDHNASLISRAYAEHFPPMTRIMYSTCNTF